MKKRLQRHLRTICPQPRPNEGAKARIGKGRISWDDQAVA